MSAMDVDPIWVARATAIQAYANLEQALCRLFALVSETPMDVAAIIFFKITNTQSRRTIVQQLFKRRFKNNYHLFCNSLLKNMKTIDDRRNAIIHWNIVTDTEVISDDDFRLHYSLKPPEFWIDTSNTTQLTIDDINDFHIQCDFYTRIVSFFDAISRNNYGPLSQEQLTSWRAIFLQPLIYPPPEGTPLYEILQQL